MARPHDRKVEELVQVRELLPLRTLAVPLPEDLSPKLLAELFLNVRLLQLCLIRVYHFTKHYSDGPPVVPFKISVAEGLTVSCGAPSESYLLPIATMSKLPPSQQDTKWQEHHLINESQMDERSREHVADHLILPHEIQGMRCKLVTLLDVNLNVNSLPQ